MRPGYFIAYHEESKRAVVAIKGTSTVGDILTDILHTPQKLPGGGFAHGGMFDASRFVLKRVGPIVRDLLHEYSVTIVGHSLGAGAAALMGHAMIHERKE